MYDITMILDIVSNMSEDLMDLFNNLQIRDNDDECLESPNCESHDSIIKALLSTKSKVTYSINIFDNIIIIENILFGINMHYIEDDSENISLYEPILRLPEFNEQKIPQKGDPRWWDVCCSEFENSIVHLRDSSYDNSSFNINNINQVDIEYNIIQLNILILNNDNDNILLNFNLVQMYYMSIYLEYFFIENNIGSIYDEEFLYTSKYFTKFAKLTIEFLKNSEQYFSYNNNYCEKYINHSLLSVLHGARNTLILFAPYGYDALKDNVDYVDLNIREIIGFKREALRYFALNNLIELKLHNKKIHIKSLNEYINVVIKGAVLFE